jgi:predicted MFS family arabinose efflux permease
VAGGLLYGSREWGGPVELRAMGCLALFGTILLLLASAPSLVVLALLMIPLGVPLSPCLGSLSTSVQRAVPSASSTEAFAWRFAAVTVAMAGGSTFGGMIIQEAGVHAAFLSAGGIRLAGVAFGSLRLTGQAKAKPPDQGSPSMPRSGGFCAAAQPDRDGGPGQRQLWATR